MSEESTTLPTELKEVFKQALPSPTPQEDPEEGDEGDEDEDDTGGGEDEPVPEHGEIFQTVEGLVKSVSDRQKRYGGVALESHDDKDKIKDASDRFLRKFEKNGFGPTVRDELRDNVYEHFKAVSGCMLAMAEQSEAMEDDLDDVIEEVTSLRTETERLRSSVNSQLSSLARLLAIYSIQRSPDIDVRTIAQMILDIVAAPVQTGQTALSAVTEVDKAIVKVEAE